MDPVTPIVDSIYLKWWGCGAFDTLLGDVNIPVDPYLFDDNHESAKPPEEEIELERDDRRKFRK